jgi:hypothetical protein
VLESFDSNACSRVLGQRGESQVSQQSGALKSQVWKQREQGGTEGASNLHHQECGEGLAARMAG